MMEDKLKSFLYMAIGLASTSEKARNMLDKMSIEGKLSEEEGRRIIDEIFNTGKGAGNELKDELLAKFNDMLLELQIPSRKDIEDLKSRITQLEVQLNELKKL